MKSSNLKRFCYVVLAFILAFSMSSCKREDIVSNTVVDSTEVRRCVKQNPQLKMPMKALVLIRNR